MVRRNLETLTNPNVLHPFLATLGASLTILTLHAIWRFVRDTRQRIYALNHMCDVSCRLLESTLIIKEHTILPHLVAIEKIIDGDEELLATLFLNDDFDILTDPPLEFPTLPKDYSLLIGYDNMTLHQKFETLRYLYRGERTRQSLNNFVKAKLKSALIFNKMSPNEQHDTLFTYHDYLSRIQGEEDRILFFIVNMLAKDLEDYSARTRFCVFSTKYAESRCETNQR